jgi:hypothetical protein
MCRGMLAAVAHSLKFIARTCDTFLVDITIRKIITMMCCACCCDELGIDLDELANLLQVR